MFTGIVEGTGKIIKVEDRAGGRVLVVDTSGIGKGLALGGSLSINGCCTTATSLDGDRFTCELMEITLQKTNLGDLRIDSQVNLERPMKIGDEIGGHLVQGHVDGVGIVTEVKKLDASHTAVIRVPKELVKYVVATGSISINGVSMTVAEIERDLVTIGIIPHTWDVTNFHEFAPGTRVNIEVDLIGKYIEKLLPDLWHERTGAVAL
jgi:riboflavin synthase